MLLCVSPHEPISQNFTLLPAGDVVVHIFLPQQRAFYNFEEFYGNTTPIELPFDSNGSDWHPNLHFETRQSKQLTARNGALVKPENIVSQ
jgi:hypothetical protein